MKPPRAFAPTEAAGLAADLRADRSLVCPHCVVALDRRDVPPRDDVSYVRDRVWLDCPSCHRTVVLDRRDS